MLLTEEILVGGSEIEVFEGRKIERTSAEARSTLWELQRAEMQGR